MTKTSTLVLGGTGNLEITRDPAGSNIVELTSKDQIVNVAGIFNDKPSNAELTYENQSGPFVIGETVTGGTSGATGVITAFKGATVLILGSVVGAFEDAEVITGGTSTETADTIGASVASPTEGEWPYRYDTMTVVQFNLSDGSRLNIELQEVSNQATWNLGTQAALQTALAAINAWL
jgi:hypothetical protein